MISGLRKSGIDIIGEISWGTHICQFYKTKEDLTEILVPYFKAGLENNEYCLWVTSFPFEVEDAVEGMSKVIPDFNVYLEKGQIEIISYKDWFLIEGAFDCKRVLNGWVEKISYASKNGYEGFRLSGNTSWLDKENWDDFISYKERSDNVISKYQMIALCTYSIDIDNIYEISQLIVNHQYTLIKHEGKWKLVSSSKSKKAEEIAYKAIKDWEHTFDAIPDLISIIDTDYKIIRTNIAMASKLGRTPEECIGLTCYSIVHETSKPPYFCPHRQMLKDGLEHTSEVCEECLGGYFIVSASPIYDSNGKFTGSIHVARDINERRKMEEALRHSEEKFRNIIETAKEGIIIIDAFFKISYVNKKMKELFGYSTKESIGKSIFCFMSEESKDIVKQNLEKKYLSFNENLEIKCIRKDGSPIWTQVNAKFLYNGDGKFTGALGMLTDVTARKEAEIKLKETLDNLENLIEERTSELEKAYNLLKENEQLLAEAQRIAHIGSWEWNIIADREHWSDEVYRIFGLEHREFELTHNAFINFIHHEDRDYVKNTINEALNGNPYNIDYRILLTDGEERVVNSHGGVILDEKSHPVKMRGIIQDITDKKKTEETLKKSEEQYRTLFNSMVEGFCIIEVLFDENWKPIDYIFVETNPAFEKHTGLSDVIGKRIRELIPSNEEYWYEIYGKVALTGESIRFENYVDGLQSWFEVYAYRIGLPINRKVALIFSDITRRKKTEEKLRESEEKYRNIVEMANEGIALLDSNGKYTYVNKKMADMLGYSENELYRKFMEDLIEDSKVFNGKFRKRKRGVSESYEIKMLRKNGPPLWVLVNAKALFDTNGKFIGSMSMVTDINQKKEAEKALEDVEIARKKEIHHRIKNNLQVISSLLDLQADKFRNRKNIKESEILEAFKESQDRVISMALIHEELYKGGGFEKLNFPPYVKKLSENLLHSNNIGNKNIILNLNLDTNIFFDMDVAIPLGMIINELISNSLKHAFAGKNEGEIQIKLYREEIQSQLESICDKKNGTSFVLILSDNGIGIPANINIEELESLGLQLVTSLVSQLDGKLEIKRNRRTEFIIRFCNR